ncbi:hypothetical protein UFOVP121_55 [uncultured Caudovirales phage]|uniref:Uncharacterized protein n=1 Tax=uncultured Caudovirales phage TaxID=2100421 RepID=A0A6J5LCY9_9CAUD|nr:hypothetical protein UFOVP121_55 [uncultured Caudovirales phage]CAB4135056.1 hypothetical protein UFOVP277_60 [uncultured Caudovirales phage]
MAGKDDFVSVLEQGDMSSPRYRAQLAREQGLEGSHPEMWGLGSLAKAAAAKVGSVAKGLRGVAFPERDLAGTVTGSPRMDEAMYALKGPAADTSGIDRALGEAQTRVASRQLTPAQKSDWKNTGVAPSNWGEMRQNASYIGADVGRTTAAPPAVVKTGKELYDETAKRVADASARTQRGYEAPMSVASAVDSVRAGPMSGLRSPGVSPNSPVEYQPAPEARSPKWNWQQEQQFRKDMTSHPWYSEFQKRHGEAPDLNSADYNYRAAYAAGVRPERYAPDDNAYHWPSSTPGGLSLKAKNHPTGWMEDYMQITGGKDPHEDYQMTPAQAATLGKSLRYRYGGQ